jgi:hypothetical protein
MHQIMQHSKYQLMQAKNVAAGRYKKTSTLIQILQGFSCKFLPIR